MTTLYDFTVSDQADQPVSLNDYKGKVVLIVNTATGLWFNATVSRFAGTL